ncbi:MAG: hypothetical protein QNJ14_15685 [Woeseiaceae bacterium]|nr:hypothetical protein [Woeseiaceae bacterium]
MIRLIGILIGSATAIGLLILTLGIPEFAAPEPEPETLPVAKPDSGLAATEAAAPEFAPPPEPAPAPAPAPAAATIDAPETERTEEVLPAMLTDEQMVEQIFSPQPEPLLEEHWYAFWSPFRSEIAAQGFVSRLQQTTGMDYRVVKLKPGVYEVAFAYTDEDDIEQKLARISAATGLEMSGG